MLNRNVFKMFFFPASSILCINALYKETSVSHSRKTNKCQRNSGGKVIALKTDESPDKSKFATCYFKTKDHAPCTRQSYNAK